MIPVRGRTGRASSPATKLRTTLFHAAQTTFALVTTGIPPLASHWLMAIVWIAAGLLALLDPAMRRRLEPMAGPSSGEPALI